MVGSSLPGFVNNAHTHAEIIEPDEIVPYEVAPCPIYGLHKMYAKGTATVKYKETGKNAIPLGTMYRCACNAIIVVEGRPPQGPIGKYAPDPTPVIGAAGHVSYVTPKKNVKSTSGYTIPGYRFH